MEITGINFTNTNSFVITARNKNNSMFYIRPKSDFERELELIKENTEKDKRPFVTSQFEGFQSEENIIQMIGDGIMFYTYNYLTETFTEVKIVDNNIKSIPNETEIDNITNLPLLG